MIEYCVPVLVVVCSVLMVLSIVRLYLFARRRGEDEPALEPLWEEHCGGRVNGRYASWPFFRVAIYPDSVYLSSGASFGISLETIIDVSIPNNHFIETLLGYRRVVIRFRNPAIDAEDRVTLYVWGASSLAEVLRGIGVDVDTSD